MVDLILSKEEKLVGVRTSWKRAASQPRVPTHKRETLKQNTAHRYQERMLQKVQRREWSCDSMRVSEGKMFMKSRTNSGLWRMLRPMSCLRARIMGRQNGL